MFVSSCGEKAVTSSGSLDFGEVNPGKKIEKTLTLDFNAAAKADKAAFLEFQFCDSLGAPVENITFLVGKRKVQGQKFRVTPADLDPNNKVRISIDFAQNAKEKEYAGYLMLVDASDELKQNISHPDTKTPINVHQKIGAFKATYKVPMPAWLFWTILASSILLIVATVIFILTRDNMPFGKKTFTCGTLGFPNGDFASVNLERLALFDISKQFGIDPGLILEPYDKKTIGSAKRMARLKNTSNLDVKIVIDNLEQVVGATEDLYNMDEVKIYLPGSVYMFNYINSKTIRTI
jgi:hypothetical protein